MHTCVHIEVVHPSVDALYLAASSLEPFEVAVLAMPLTLKADSGAPVSPGLDGLSDPVVVAAAL